MKYRVTVYCGGHEVGFTFGEQFLADAIEFVKTCMETCDSGTDVSIKYMNEEDEQ